MPSGNHKVNEGTFGDADLIIFSVANVNAIYAVWQCEAHVFSRIEALPNAWTVFFLRVRHKRAQSNKMVELGRAFWPAVCVIRAKLTCAATTYWAAYCPPGEDAPGTLLVKDGVCNTQIAHAQQMGALQSGKLAIEERCAEQVPVVRAEEIVNIYVHPRLS